MPYSSIDLSARITALRTTGAAIGVPSGSLPAQQAARDDLSCLGWINKQRAFKSATLLRGLDYTGFTKAINDLAALGPAISFPPFPAGAAAIYSLRQTSASYAGKCLQVRRGSDNVTQDIGFDSNGNLDMAAAATFAGGNQLLVAKWYDQSGNGRDVIQTIAVNQPCLVSLNGRPWIGFNHEWKTILQVATTFTTSGDQTIGAVATFGSDNAMALVSDFGSNGWFIMPNGVGSDGAVGPNPKKNAYYSATPGAALIDTANLMARGANRVVVTRASGTATMYLNGVQTATGSGRSSTTSGSGFAIGALDTTLGANAANYNFEGTIAEVFIYIGTALSGAQLTAIDANQATQFPDPGFSTPYSGTAGVQFGVNQKINCGNILSYERTLSWTVFAAVQVYTVSDASVIYTNVASAPPWFGHEIWFDNLGRLRVRIMGNWTAGGNGLAGVIGTTNICDGKKHMIAYSYNGSSTVAGIKIYIDGVLETTTIEDDTLTSTIIGSGQLFYVGSQQAQGSFNLLGTLSYFQVDKVVRSAAYIAPIKNGALPTVDANTDLCFPLNEGTGITAGDTSGHSRNGTLSSATMWVP